MKSQMLEKRKSGFTLIEIMIVTIIIGMLAALAIPAFTNAKINRQNTRLLNDMRIFSGAIETFALQGGEYPEDSSSGTIPTGLEEYIQTDRWLRGSPIGGVWDVEFNQFGVVSAVGVHRFTVSTAQLARFDSSYDDGDLSSGKFRRLAGDRYYYIIEE